MPPRLLNHAIARIDQYNRQVCRACAGNHVTRVLHMTRSISHDKFPLRRGHITVGNIDRDTLLAFGAQTVGEVCKIHLPAAGDIRRPLQRLHLIFHNGLGIVKQPPDQRALAVINRAAGVKPQQLDGLLRVAHSKNTPLSFGPPSPPHWLCRRREYRAR